MTLQENSVITNKFTTWIPSVTHLPLEYHSCKYAPHGTKYSRMRLKRQEWKETGHFIIIQLKFLKFGTTWFRFYKWRIASFCWQESKPFLLINFSDIIFLARTL